MKTKNILIGILALLSFSTYAQSEKERVIETKIAVTELNLKTDNLEDFSKVYWDMLKGILKENEPNQEISLTIAYVNSSKVNPSQNLIDDFKFEFKGKSSELVHLMTSDLKKSFATLSKLTK